MFAAVGKTAAASIVLSPLLAAEGASLNSVAGPDRVTILPGKTYLRGWTGYGDAPHPIRSARGVPQPVEPPPVPTGPAPAITWSKESGPGSVTFADSKAPITTATFSKPGDYVLKLTADNGQTTSTSTLTVKVDTPPPARQLDAVYTKNFKLDSPLWN